MNQGMKTLFPSLANPATWRTSEQQRELKRSTWRKLRLQILERDDYTCVYCGHRADKGQIVNHVDGDPSNNSSENLETVCSLCNYVLHVGLGAAVHGVIQLYGHSNVSQNEIIHLTRQWRENGLSDKEIIKKLGLSEPMPFRMDRDYLKGLYAFPKKLDRSLSATPRWPGRDKMPL